MAYLIKNGYLKITPAEMASIANYITTRDKLLFFTKYTVAFDL